MRHLIFDLISEFLYKIIFKEVLEDGIKPVFETAVFLENHITAQRKNMKRVNGPEDLMMLDIDDMSNASSDQLGCQKTCLVSDLKCKSKKTVLDLRKTMR